MKNDNLHQAGSEATSNSEAPCSSIALARVYLRSGCFRDAEGCARRALGAGPDGEPEALLILAESLLLQGRQSEALAVRSSINEPIPTQLTADIRILDARLLVESAQYRECACRFAVTRDHRADSIQDVLLQQIVAEALARTNDLATLRQVIEWVISESERLGWQQGVADGLQKLGLLDRMEGNWARGEELLLRAREIYLPLGLSKKYVQATINLGLHRLFRGHLTFACDLLSEAVRLAIEIGDLRFEATARADRGLALVRLGRTTEARAEFARSLRLCRRQASPRRTAIALEYVGELHLTSRNYPRATSALRRSLAIANRIAPDGDIVPEVLRRQAEVALAIGDTTTAMILAKDADARADRYGDKYERATAIRVQAQVLYATGAERNGEALLRSALQSLEELGETFERDRILGILGELEDDAIDVAVSEAPLTSTIPTTSDSPRPPNKSRMIELARRHGLFGSSRRLLDVVQEAAQVASLEIPVLIQGETGTGKELLAQAIHKMGRWSEGPMVAFNCATCPADLLDAELFGHTRGAFTGATRNRDGLVRSAEGGTLFLDEVGELREDSQARLLRFLDSGEVRSLGSDETSRVRVRILAATHVDLEDRITRKKFRRDLYYRLTGLRLILPPLRERKSDIRELLTHFSDEARSTVRPDFAGFSRNVITAMERAPWPGNVRQLRSEVLRLAALAESGVPIDRWDSPDCVRFLDPTEELEDPDAVLGDPARLTALLGECGGRVADVAVALRVSRGHVYRVLQNYGLKAKAYRSDR